MKEYKLVSDDYQGFEAEVNHLTSEGWFVATNMQVVMWDGQPNYSILLERIKN